MRKLYRSSRDKKIFGICGGLAEYFGLDATLLRVLLIIVTVFSAGSVIIVYVIAGFVIPREPAYGGGYDATPPPYGGWGGRDPRQAPRDWQPNTPPQWNAPTPPPRPQAPDYGRPPAYPQASPAARPAQAPGIDQMMEDIEKKALRKELEELRAKIDKIEKESKGE